MKRLFIGRRPTAGNTPAKRLALITITTLFGLGTTFAGLPWRVEGRKSLRLSQELGALIGWQESRESRIAAHVISAACSSVLALCCGTMPARALAKLQERSV